MIYHKKKQTNLCHVHEYRFLQFTQLLLKFPVYMCSAMPFSMLQQFFLLHRFYWSFLFIYYAQFLFSSYLKSFALHRFYWSFLFCHAYLHVTYNSSRSINECPGYDTKQSDGEVPVMLEPWGIQSSSSLPLLPGLSW